MFSQFQFVEFFIDWFYVLLFRWPCLSLGLWKDVVVGGYGCGHLRVFSASTGNITAEVTAHAKWINTIDIAKESGLVSLTLVYIIDHYCIKRCLTLYVTS